MPQPRTTARSSTAPQQPPRDGTRAPQPPTATPPHLPAQPEPTPPRSPSTRLPQPHPAARHSPTRPPSPTRSDLQPRPPVQRSPAQIEAARRNGSRSRGPVTSEGKARSSKNALKHGLRAAHHLVLPDEDASAYAGLLAALLTEHRPASAPEQDLTRQLAATMWKQDRADRLEAEQLAAAPEQGHGLPLADDLAHHAGLDALRRHHARLGREQSRILGQLHQLRREALVAKRASEPRRHASAAAVLANEPRLSASASLLSHAGQPLAASFRPGALHATGGVKERLTTVRIAAPNEPRTAAMAAPANEPGAPVSRQHRRWLERQARKAARRKG